MSASETRHSTALSDQVRQALQTHAPAWADRIWPLLRRLWHLDDMDAFMKHHGTLDTEAFITTVLQHFNTHYCAPDTSLIPETGALIIFANHPLGALDALALLHWVRQRRPDTRIVANRWLKAFTPLAPALIEVDNFTIHAGGHKHSWQQMNAHLRQGGALIIFPAGEVSRLTLRGIRDRAWHTGFVRLAWRHHAPLLPVRIHARNSMAFYAASLAHNALGTFLLPHQLYARRGQTIHLQPGRCIAPHTLPGDNARLWTQHLYQQLYQLP